MVAQSAILREMGRTKGDDPAKEPGAFERTLKALVQVPKAEVDALEAARTKRVKSPNGKRKPKAKRIS